MPLTGVGQTPLDVDRVPTGRPSPEGTVGEPRTRAARLPGAVATGNDTTQGLEGLINALGGGLRLAGDAARRERLETDLDAAEVARVNRLQEQAAEATAEQLAPLIQERLLEAEAAGELGLPEDAEGQRAAMEQLAERLASENLPGASEAHRRAFTNRITPRLTRTVAAINGARAAEARAAVRDDFAATVAPDTVADGIDNLRASGMNDAEVDGSVLAAMNRAASAGNADLFNALDATLGDRHADVRAELQADLSRSQDLQARSEIEDLIASADADPAEIARQIDQDPNLSGSSRSTLRTRLAQRESGPSFNATAYRQKVSDTLAIAAAQQIDRGLGVQGIGDYEYERPDGSGIVDEVSAEEQRSAGFEIVVDQRFGPDFYNRLANGQWRQDPAQVQQFAQLMRDTGIYPDRVRGIINQVGTFGPADIEGNDEGTQIRRARAANAVALAREINANDSDFTSINQIADGKTARRLTAALQIAQNGYADHEAEALELAIRREADLARTIRGANLQLDAAIAAEINGGLFGRSVENPGFVAQVFDFDARYHMAVSGTSAQDAIRLAREQINQNYRIVNRHYVDFRGLPAEDRDAVAAAYPVVAEQIARRMSSVGRDRGDRELSEVTPDDFKLVRVADSSTFQIGWANNSPYAAKGLLSELELGEVPTIYTAGQFRNIARGLAYDVRESRIQESIIDANRPTPVGPGNPARSSVPLDRRPAGPANPRPSGIDPQTRPFGPGNPRGERP